MRFLLVFLLVGGNVFAGEWSSRHERAGTAVSATFEQKAQRGVLPAVSRVHFYALNGTIDVDLLLSPTYVPEFYELIRDLGPNEEPYRLFNSHRKGAILTASLTRDKFAFFWSYFREFLNEVEESMDPEMIVGFEAQFELPNCQ